MSKLQFDELGPRHISTTWTLLNPNWGQWFVSEVRHYANEGMVIAMPERAVPFSTPGEAMGSIPDNAEEQQSPSTMRSWRYDTPMLCMAS